MNKRIPTAGAISIAGRTSEVARTSICVLVVLILSSAITSVGAQGSPPPDNYNYARFSPSMAIIIVILVAALFFMGFFSIYIRRCSNDGSSVRQALSMRRGRTVAASRGLDAQVIETFPTFPYATVKGLKIGKGALECAVCLCEFEDDETLRLIPKCDHVFHPECIDAWLENHVTCPVCRTNLVPQPGDPVHTHDELLADNGSNSAELGNTQENGDVSIRISDDHEVINDLEAPQPEVLNRDSSLKQNRPPRSGKSFRKFRSHSTGHSLVQPGENTDRYTLRLPEEVRKQVMNRAMLNRNASSVVMPRVGSSRRGFRTSEGSNRGRSYGRLESLRIGRSDRWIFARAPSFLTRAFSPRSPKVVADNEATSSSSRGTTPKGSKKPPILSSSSEPKSDEIILVKADSAQLPV